MKIIMWNCSMAFRKKGEFILSHNPDVLIVPECDHPDKLTEKAYLSRSSPMRHAVFL
ncbi:hypothetical protein ACVW2L_003070 [Mucilaginibacter sp. HD30]